MAVKRAMRRAGREWKIKTETFKQADKGGGKRKWHGKTTQTSNAIRRWGRRKKKTVVPKKKVVGERVEKGENSS